MHRGMRNLLYFVLLSVLYTAFMAVAAYIIYKVEKPFEQEWRERMRAQKENLASRECVDEKDLENLIRLVEEGQYHGHSAVGTVDSEDGWSWGSSFLFAISIGTTVGYGHLCPGSDWGKTLTACLTVVSVPLTLLVTTVMVIRLLTLTRKLRGCLERCLGDSIGLFPTRLLHLSIVFTFVLSIFVVIAAVVFLHFEPTWNFYEALYFSIISVSTVGLGDYIPGYSLQGNDREIYLVGCAVFLIFGVVIVLLVLETLYEIPELGIHVYLLPTDDEDDTSDVIKGDDKQRLVADKPSGYGSQDTVSTDAPTGK